jgi:hypothetical protein
VNTRFYLRGCEGEDLGAYAEQAFLELRLGLRLATAGSAHGLGNPQTHGIPVTIAMQFTGIKSMPLEV